MHKVGSRKTSPGKPWVLAFAALMAACTGCDTAERFRAAAGGPLHSGVQSIATGLIDGVFAVFEPEVADDAS